MTPDDSAANWSRRRVLASLLGVGAVAPFVRGSRDVTGDSVVLRYTAHIPNSHGLYGKVFLPWEELVTERTGGRIRWEHFVDKLLHGPLDGFKAVATGVTDYTHAYATYQPGSFHLTHGLQLPFLFPSPGVAALVSEELYPEYLKDEYERMGVYLAHCDSTSAYDIISKTPIRSPSDIRGLKVRATGGLTAAIIRQVGAVPVVMAAAETYTAFQRGILDAVALGGPDMAAYRLHETGNYFTRVGLTHTVLQYCLSPRTFDGLPEDLRVELYNLFRLRGQVAHRNYYGGEALDRSIETLVAGGVEIIELTPDEQQEWVDAILPLERRFIEENEARGLPAGDFVREARQRAAVYDGWTDQQLWDHILERPVQGIIAL
ncbi:MAG: TRAP transporter substrate-binding protein DctP [Gemmatimonadetes bacterium]|jgi:TRAP-type C4-dicarboxylate transport system substrate-binding protein|nr:TRAP transporter substrate-binding protein DctP [Gemmatimonadota bacterium]